VGPPTSFDEARNLEEVCPLLRASGETISTLAKGSWVYFVYHNTVKINGKNMLKHAESHMATLETGHCGSLHLALLGSLDSLGQFLG
jgi:hypothetical protein